MRRETTGKRIIPAPAAIVLNGHHSGYGISAGIPNSGSPPPNRRTSETLNAAIQGANNQVFEEGLATARERMLEGEGAFFVKKGCFVCHSVSTLGVESASKIGPDLSEAFTDVQSRFGRQLEDFLNNPTGTMAVVLSTQIILSPEEKREAVEKLKIAYQKKTEQQAKSTTEPKGQPPAQTKNQPKK